MRLARDVGSVSGLFPDFDDLLDLPHVLFDAIQRALFYLSFEELAKDEVPPKRIWGDDERLQEWFDEVRRRRASGDSSKQIEDPVDNEAAKGLIVG